MKACVPFPLFRMIMEKNKDNKDNPGRRELDWLLDQGVKITLDGTRYERGRWPWSRPKEVREKIVYELQQPTLGCLDLINYYVGDIAIDETSLHDTVNPFPELRRLGRKHTRNVAMAMAVAVLGRRAFVRTWRGYRPDNALIRRTAEEIVHSTTNSNLFEMARALSVMCNLSDFLNSIRLMQVAPDRIEPDERA